MRRSLSTSFPEQAIYFYCKQFFPDAISRYKGISKTGLELDIFIPSIRVGIEYDGLYFHNFPDVKDREKRKYEICKARGIKLIRIREGNVPENWQALPADTVYYLEKRTKDDELSNFLIFFFTQLTTFTHSHIIGYIDPDTKEQRTGFGLPVNINIKRDKAKIMEYLIDIEHSFGKLYPQIARSWHPTKNGNLKPEMFPPHSGFVAWWHCDKCGLDWKTTISNRTKGHGCDFCAREKRKETYHQTRLQTRKLLKDHKCLLDWDYSKNKHSPDYYTKGSGEKVWWKCHACGHEWLAPICDRTRDYKNGCPACSLRILVPGVNDLLTTNPELCKEWHPTKNGDLKPSDVTQYSHKKVWWKCSKCGYSYLATPSNRVIGKGCGCCAGRVVVPGINDLATTRPDIAMDWHPTKNGKLKPFEVTKGRRTLIWWKCHICGYEWADSLNHRNGGRGCPSCKKEKKKVR